jgi:hypothetical protein
MSRTYRRRGELHEYRWVLSDSRWNGALFVPSLIDPRSKEGRRTLARFHSDAHVTLRSRPPSWYRRMHDHQLRTLNVRELRRWLDDPRYDPVFQVQHRHSANYSWW